MPVWAPTWCQNCFCEEALRHSRTRRTVALFEDTISGLEEIKASTGAGSDNAAINDAVKFRACFSKRNPEEITNALALWDRVKRDELGGEINSAISLRRRLKKEVSSGHSVFIEHD